MKCMRQRGRLANQLRIIFVLWLEGCPSRRGYRALRARCVRTRRGTCGTPACDGGACTGHPARAPMRRIRWLLFEGLGDDRLDPGVPDLTRRAATRFVVETVQAVFG